MAIINFAITVPDASVSRLRTALRAHYGEIIDAGTGQPRARTNAELEESVRQMVVHNLKSIIRSTEAAAAAKAASDGVPDTIAT